MRLSIGLVLLMFTLARSAAGAPAIGLQDAFAGPWETTIGDSVVGIFFSFHGQRTDIATFHRAGGEETWAWYVEGISADFDGAHVRVSGLDATIGRSGFAGTWILNGETRQVMLARPHPSPGLTQSPLCGDWRATNGTLHILQSVDGTVLAWMNRTLTASDHRFGERLHVVAIDDSTVTLDVVAAVGAPYRFAGKASRDGKGLNGTWTPSLQAPSSFRR
jgi:hypothetical protein